MFFESSLGELTKFIANGVPKLSSEPSKRTMVLIQSRSVNIKIAGGGEPGLVIKCFSFVLMKTLLMLVGTVRHETSNIIEETVSTYNIFKGRIFEEVNKGTACALGSEKYINRRTRFCSRRIFCKWDLAA